jgi:hypothetical protein
MSLELEHHRISNWYTKCSNTISIDFFCGLLVDCSLHYTLLKATFLSYSFENSFITYMHSLVSSDSMIVSIQSSGM